MRRTWSVPVVVALWLIVEGVALAQPPGASAQDAGAARARTRLTKNPLEGNREAIRNGGPMFRTRCAGCHGPDARGDRGPDLTGLWASGVSDDRIFDTVRQGGPGSEMPVPTPPPSQSGESGRSPPTCPPRPGPVPPQGFTGPPQK